jgi:hypothetical protein
MANNNMTLALFKYSWDQEVQVAATAPVNMHPGQAGSVCGMRESNAIRLYLIEFSDGQAVEIPEIFLEPVP